VSCAGGLVVAVKLALVCPDGTVTLAGQVFNAVLLQLSVTTAPPLGAGELRVTVPIVLLPPTTGFGLNVRLVGKGGGVPHTFAVPAPPQVCVPLHVPQLSQLPQPSGMPLQVLPWSAHVVGRHGPQTFALPPPPQVCEPPQVPQFNVPPQPSERLPQFLPSAAQVIGAQVGGGITAMYGKSEVEFSAVPTIVVPSAEMAVAKIRV